MKIQRIDSEFYLEEEYNLSIMQEGNISLTFEESPMYGNATDLKDFIENYSSCIQLNNVTHKIISHTKISYDTYLIRAKLLSTNKGSNLLKYIYKFLPAELCKIVLTCDNNFESEINNLRFSAQMLKNSEYDIKILTFNIVKNDV